MHDAYSYLLLNAPRDQMAGLRSSLGDAPVALAGSGAAVAGTWFGAGSVGWFDDEAIVLLSWGGPRGEITGLGSSLPPGTELEVTALTATARPATPGLLRSDGVHAHRWLEVEPGHEAEVVELSAEAWPAFEASFEARIEGLFATEDGSGRMLLITWYSSFAEWERSRQVAGASEGALADARRNFQRRRELTGRQVVRLARPHG